MKKLISKFREFIDEGSLGRTLYHYSNFEGDKFTLDPARFTDKKFRKSYSRNDYNVSQFPRVFFYTDPENKEALVRGNLFAVNLVGAAIYDLDKDPDGVVSKLSAESPTGNMRAGVEWEDFFEEISTKYDGVFYKIHDDIGVVAWFKPIEVTRVESS